MSLRPLLPAALGLTIACRDGATASDAPLAVAPDRVACVAGDRIELAATADGRSVPATFTVRGDGAWLAAVARDRGSATLVCEAEGSGSVLVESAGGTAVVDVHVDPPPTGTLRLTLTPAALSLVNGTAAPLSAAISSARPGVSTAPRFYSTDPSIATVDSIFGLVTAAGPGTVAIVAAARADRGVRQTATVTVTRGSAFAVSLVVSPAGFRLVVGDSGRAQATVQLATTAPAGTSRAVNWATDDPRVAVVSPNGVVRAVGQGTTFVLATAVAAPKLAAGVPVTVIVPP
jgi:hypothetical protein